MAIARGRFAQKPDGSMEGCFVAGRASVSFAVIPDRDKPHDAAPGSRIINKRAGSGGGAGWTSQSLRSGKEKTSFKLEATEFDVIYGNLAPAPGGDENKKVILWNNPE